MPIMASKRLMVLGNARRPGVSEAASFRVERQVAIELVE